MLKQFITSIFLVVAFLITSCDTNNKKPSLADTASPTPGEELASLQIRNKVSGFLDTLWIDRTSFEALDNDRHVLMFSIGELDTLTLHGWKVKGLLGDEFDPTPKIKLLKGSKSAAPYGPGTYFGDLILKGTFIRDIKKKLQQNNAKTVLFAPQNLNGFVSYTIFVSKDERLLSDTLEFVSRSKPIETSTFANPSPPRNFKTGE